MLPFEYPSKKHRRRFSVPDTGRHDDVKATLRLEFAGQCIYCRHLDSYKGTDGFGVEHYRPRSRFPHLAATYSNLFYACNACNRRKSDRWPSAAEMKRGHYVPNPCDHVMARHFRYDGPRVEAESLTGTFAEPVLMLNDYASVEYRKHHLSLIDGLRSLRRRIDGDLRVVNSQLRKERSPTQVTQLQAERMELLSAAREIEQNLEVLLGKRLLG